MTPNYLKDIIDYGHHDAIKHWLKISGLKPHSASSKIEFYNLLERHIGEGKLQLAQLRRLSLELNEHGQKRVYLGKLINFNTIKLRQRFENHLKSLRLSLDDLPERKTELPSRPHLDYICWTPQEVRIGYCETHESKMPDRATLTWKTVTRTNYITISADCATGTVNMMMDAPGEQHPHQATFRGEQVLGYVPYYRAKAIELLGVNDFESINLLKAARAIANHPTVFQRKRAVDRTAHNSRVITVSTSDVTEDPAYTAGVEVDGKDHVYAGLSGFWLPEGSKKQLHRQIFMTLNHEEEMVQFPGINLASEVEYAVSRIRSL
jgi:hypothetical protein